MQDLTCSGTGVDEGLWVGHPRVSCRKKLSPVKWPTVNALLIMVLGSLSLRCVELSDFLKAVAGERFSGSNTVSLRQSF